MISKDLTAASSSALVLSILAGGDSYGYQIIQSVRELPGFLALLAIFVMISRPSIAAGTQTKRLVHRCELLHSVTSMDHMIDSRRYCERNLRSTQ